MKVIISTFVFLLLLAAAPPVALIYIVIKIISFIRMPGGNK